MKNFKKLAAATAALMIAATMSVTAFASEIPESNANTYTISVNDSTESTYYVYQLATGTFKEVSGQMQLFDAVAGESLADGIDVKTLETRLNGVTKDNVTHIDQLVDGKEPIATLGSDHTSVDGLEEGYYYVREVQGDGNTAKNAAILKIAGGDDTEINIVSKLGAVDFQKKLKDINDSQANSLTNWQDGADWDVGDDVPFQLKATLPENVSSYEGYYLQLRDSIDSAFGISANNPVKNLTVKVGGKTIEANTTAGANKGYDVVYVDNGFTITFPDIKHVCVNNDVDPNNAVVTVEYEATLGNPATVGQTGDQVKYGQAGNPNTAYAVYSSNPDFDMYGEKTTETEGGSDEIDDTDTPTTPDTPDTPSSEEENTTSTPEDKVKVFTYIVQIDKVNEDGDPLQGATFKLEKQGETENSWTEIERLVVEGNIFVFYGLDDGVYKLTEVNPPRDYNAIDPIVFTVDAGHDTEANDPELITLTATDLVADPVSGDLGTGIIQADIENVKGQKLPETGGMGTKLFYAVGGSITGLAGVALITKKRMSKKNK